MDDYRDFSVSAEDCAKWADKLERMADKFKQIEDFDNARLMYLCSLLMRDLVFKLEAESFVTPFGPVKGGEC